MPTNVNINELGGASVPEGSPVRTCPICDANLPGLSLLQMEAHINRCLDGPQMSGADAEQVSHDQSQETIPAQRTPPATLYREISRSETTVDEVRSNMSLTGRSDSLYSFECSSAERIANIEKFPEKQSRDSTRDATSFADPNGKSSSPEDPSIRPDLVYSLEHSSAARVEMYTKYREMYANQDRSPPQPPTSGYQAYSLPTERRSDEYRNNVSFEANADFSFPSTGARNTVPRTLPNEELPSGSD